jgi:hypothetical protein
MDYRRELNLIRKHYRNHQKDHGETVVWYEFIPFGTNNATDSMYDDVYDEGAPGVAGRRYKKGLTIPVLSASEQEDTKRAIPEGRQPVQTTSLVISIEDMRAAGVTAPFEYQTRLNDMFLYDGRYFSIQTYRVRGRLKDDLLAIVDGTEIYLNQEMPFDIGPSSYSVQNLPWPTKLPTPPSIA